MVTIGEHLTGTTKLDRVEIYELYVDKKMTVEQIASTLNTSVRDIHEIVDTFQPPSQQSEGKGDPVMPMKPATPETKKVRANISPQLLDDAIKYLKVVASEQKLTKDGRVYIQDVYTHLRAKFPHENVGKIFKTLLRKQRLVHFGVKQAGKGSRNNTYYIEPNEIPDNPPTRPQKLTELTKEIEKNLATSVAHLTELLDSSDITALGFGLISKEVTELKKRATVLLAFDELTLEQKAYLERLVKF